VGQGIGGGVGVQGVDTVAVHLVRDTGRDTLFPDDVLVDGMRVKISVQSARPAIYHRPHGWSMLKFTSGIITMRFKHNKIT
jgi:hypothetical protein